MQWCSFPVTEALEAWCWTLIIIYCQGREYAELRLHFPVFLVSSCRDRMIQSGAVTCSRDVGGENEYIIMVGKRSSKERTSKTWRSITCVMELGNRMNVGTGCSCFRIRSIGGSLWPWTLITIKVANILTDKIPVSVVRFSLMEFNSGTEGYVAWRKEPYSFLGVFAK